VVRSVVNNLSTLQIVAIFVGGSVLLAISLAIAIRKAIPDIAEREFEELASGLRVVYELLFALILAFAIASVIDKFSDAEATVDTEATALSQMLRANRSFPPELQSRLRDGIDHYIAAVVGDEWETMSRGESSREASAALDTVSALYQAYTPASDNADKFHDIALQHLDVVATARRERLGISTARLPLILVLMLPVGALLLLILEYRPHLRPRGQVAFMGTFALVVSSTYLLTILLDYPFSGDFTVSHAPLESGNLAYLADHPPRRPQAGDKQLKLTPQALTGVFISDAYGAVVLRSSGNRIRGAYRTANGLVRGVVTPDGTFRGAWCEGSQDPDKFDGGSLEWTLIQTKSGERIIDGRWQFGYERRSDGSFTAEAGWDMHKLKNDTAQDLERRLARQPESAFCHVR
jgi:Protein of unknown function (DUF4239)